MCPTCCMFSSMFLTPRMSAPLAAHCRLCPSCLWLEIALLWLVQSPMQDALATGCLLQSFAVRYDSLYPRWKPAFPTIWRASMPTGLTRRFPTYLRHGGRGFFEPFLFVIFDSPMLPQLFMFGNPMMFRQKMTWSNLQRAIAVVFVRSSEPTHILQHDCHRSFWLCHKQLHRFSPSLSIFGSMQA